MMTLFNNIGNWYVAYFDKCNVWNFDYLKDVRSWMIVHPALTGLGFVTSVAMLAMVIIIMIKAINR